MRRKCRKNGFSLLELLAVVTIMGVIAAVTIARIASSTDTAKQKCSLQYRADLNAALERHYFETSSFPMDLDTLYTAGYYSEPIPLDPVTNLPFELDVANGRVAIP